MSRRTGWVGWGGVHPRPCGVNTVWQNHSSIAHIPSAIVLCKQDSCLKLGLYYAGFEQFLSQGGWVGGWTVLHGTRSCVRSGKVRPPLPPHDHFCRTSCWSLPTTRLCPDRSTPLLTEILVRRNHLWMDRRNTSANSSLKTRNRILRILDYKVKMAAAILHSPRA